MLQQTVHGYEHLHRKISNMSSKTPLALLVVSRVLAWEVNADLTIMPRSLISSPLGIIANFSSSDMMS